MSLPPAVDWEDASRPENPRVFLEISINGHLVAEKIVIELFASVVPKTAENFRVLCTGEKSTPGKPLHYKGTFFNTIIKDFVCQGGATSNEEDGGESIYGGYFKDENFLLRHSGPGMLSMSGQGQDANGSLFYITFCQIRFLDGFHVVFGKVIDGWRTLNEINQMGTPGVRRKPFGLVQITNCGEIKNNVMAQITDSGEIKNNVMESHEGKKKKTLKRPRSFDAQVEELSDEGEKKRRETITSGLLQITNSGGVSKDKKNKVMESDKGKMKKTLKGSSSSYKRVEELSDEGKKKRRTSRPSRMAQITDSGEVSEDKKNNVRESDKGEKKKTLKGASSSDGKVEELSDEGKKKRKKSRTSRMAQITDSGEVSEDKKIMVMESDKGKKKKTLKGASCSDEQVEELSDEGKKKQRKSAQITDISEIKN